MTFKEFFGQNYVMLFELIGLLITVHISAHLPKETKIYARITIILLLFTMVIHTVESCIQDLPHAIAGRYILTSAKYITYPIIMMCIILVIAPTKKKISLKNKLLFLAPELISIPFYITMHWHKLIIYYTVDENYVSHFHGGPLRYWAYIIFGIYTGLFLFFNLLMMRKYSHRNKQIIAYICIGAVAGIIIFLVLDITDDYTPIFTSSLLLYYLLLYIHLSNIDQLTRLMSRHTYVQDIETRSSKFHGIISVDMNELKYLNDNFGHDKGDEALQCIAKILQDYSGDNCIQYRVGGDEFVILYFKADEETLKYNIRKMKEKLEETEYSCAFGYALKSEDEDILEALKRSDEVMYKDKEEMKEEMLKRGKILHTRD